MTGGGKPRPVSAPIVRGLKLRLWLSGPRRGRRNGEHLSGACRKDVVQFIGAAPFRRYEEQRLTVGAAKRAAQYRAVVFDPVQLLTPFPDASDGSAVPEGHAGVRSSPEGPSP